VFDLADTPRIYREVAVHANETAIVQLAHESFQPSFTRSYAAAIRGQPDGVSFSFSEDYLLGMQNDQPVTLNCGHSLRQPVRRLGRSSLEAQVFTCGLPQCAESSDDAVVLHHRADGERDNVTDVRNKALDVANPGMISPGPGDTFADEFPERRAVRGDSQEGRPAWGGPLVADRDDSAAGIQGEHGARRPAPPPLKGCLQIGHVMPGLLPQVGPDALYRASQPRQDGIREWLTPG